MFKCRKCEVSLKYKDTPEIHVKMHDSHHFTCMTCSITCIVKENVSRKIVHGMYLNYYIHKIKTDHCGKILKCIFFFFIILCLRCKACRKTNGTTRHGNVS